MIWANKSATWGVLDLASRASQSVFSPRKIQGMIEGHVAGGACSNNKALGLPHSSHQRESVLKACRAKHALCTLGRALPINVTFLLYYAVYYHNTHTRTHVHTYTGTVSCQIT